MNIQKTAAALFIAVGIAGLIYGEFTYSRESPDAGRPPISVDRNRPVNVIGWMGTAAISFGGFLLIVRTNRQH